MSFSNRFLLGSIRILFVFSCTVSNIPPASSIGNGASTTPGCPYFPSRMHAFIWRNWESVSMDRMAKVLETSPANILEAGRSMGLPPYREPVPEFRNRGYVSLIRRNWHLISYGQMLTLLDWDAGQLDQTLRDDDFLWVKVGGMKPQGPPLKYTEPGPATRERCAEIRKTVEENFGGALTAPGEERFAFIRKLSSIDENYSFSTEPGNSMNGSIRIIYSYFAPFGDPLLHPELDPFPEGLLQRLNALGINGVWLHVALHQLTPSKIFPELGKDHETRLANLQKLAQSAGRYGIRIFLYMNEPRAMPPSFFKNREEILGYMDGDFGTLCTSVPLVRQWLKESLTGIFARVPELGGVFTITASENLTNCWSRQHGDRCPRCSGREPAEVIAEVNQTIAEGVWNGQPDARVIVWDWGWPDGTAWGEHHWAADIIKKLPDSVYHMSVSEWSLPLQRGGVTTRVGEYSISAVGPGPRALRLWKVARDRNLGTMAKVQVNNTWELSAIPYLPVMNLIGQHMKNLQQEDLAGLMLSWSLGGYPSPNLHIVKYIQDHPCQPLSQSLLQTASMRYGEAAAPYAVEAWERFSSAFGEFPYGLSIYTAPMNYGASNPFYVIPTGEKATMLGFPFDDLDRWRGSYPVEILAEQFEKLADGWDGGLPGFKNTLANAAGPVQKMHALEDYRFATTAWIHFSSVANQIRFIMARDSVLSGNLGQEALEAALKDMEEIARDERQLARQMYRLSQADSRIGFEASNHYYYLPLDFVEKVINCEYILNKWLPDQESKALEQK